MRSGFNKLYYCLCEYFTERYRRSSQVAWRLITTKNQRYGWLSALQCMLKKYCCLWLCYENTVRARRMVDSFALRIRVSSQSRGLWWSSQAVGRAASGERRRAGRGAVVPPRRRAAPLASTLAARPTRPRDHNKRQPTVNPEPDRDKGKF